MAFPTAAMRARTHTRLRTKSCVFFSSAHHQQNTPHGETFLFPRLLAKRLLFFEEICAQLTTWGSWGPRMENQHGDVIAKGTSKWKSLGEQVAKLKEGESIILEPAGDPAQEASKVRSGLNGVRACRLVRRAVQVVDGKIVITRIGSWPMLSAFRHTPIATG
jgi:hypothetical protein